MIKVAAGVLRARAHEYFIEFVVLLSPSSFWVVNQIVTSDNNKIIDDNKQPFWCILLHYLYVFGRFSCKNEKHKLSTPKVQTICITNTSPLYQRYKAFVPEVQTFCTTSKGLFEQPEETILTTARDYLNDRKRLSTQ